MFIVSNKTDGNIKHQLHWEALNILLNWEADTIYDSEKENY